MCVFYNSLLTIFLYYSSSYSNTLYNDCYLYNSQTGNVAAAEFRCCSACWQVWSWSSNLRFLLLILSVDSSKNSGRREQAESDRHCGRSMDRNLNSSRSAAASNSLPYGMKWACQSVSCRQIATVAVAISDRLYSTVPRPAPHSNSNTLQNCDVCLDLSAVTKSTGKYKERFIVCRPRHRNVTKQVLNSGKELAKFELFRGVLLKLRDVWIVECPLSGSECAHSGSSFTFLTVIHISLRQSDAPFRV